ncbi:hypothetical protein Peur_051810 [Populus x canadensis]
METYNFPGFQKKEEGRENLWRSHFKSGSHDVLSSCPWKDSLKNKIIINCFELIINGWN